MINLIDESYFIEPIALPTQSSGSGIDGYIKKYQPEILLSLLGRTLYDDMSDNIDSEKWQAFINGYEYTTEYDSKTITVKWIGLKNSIKQSLIANYIYCKVLEDNAITATNVGTVIANTENSTVVNSNVLISKAWNRMLSMYGNSCDAQIFGTAYNFLRYSEYDFEDWIFTELDLKNSWGI